MSIISKRRGTFKLLSMELIGSRFEAHSKLFPDQIMNLSTEIQQTGSDLISFFDNDIRDIRRIIREKR